MDKFKISVMREQYGNLIRVYVTCLRVNVPIHLHPINVVTSVVCNVSHMLYVGGPRYVYRRNNAGW